ncbi:hypothetical protein BST61_g34 [Cercospora zeina]
MRPGFLLNGGVFGLLTSCVTAASSTTSDADGIGNESASVDITATAPAVLESSARVISVTNTTLITKVLQAVKLPEGLQTPHVKARPSSCVTTLSTTRCYADDPGFTFVPTTATFTDVYVAGHTFVTSRYTTQAVATMSIASSIQPGSPGKNDEHLDVFVSTGTRDRILELMRNACFEAGHLKKRQHPLDGTLGCDISRDLEAGLYNQLGGEITKQLGDVILPLPWAAYFLSVMIPQHVINRAYQLSTAMTIMTAGYQLHQAIDWNFSVPLRSFWSMINVVRAADKPTATSATKTTSNGCARCTNTAACKVNPNDDQGSEGEIGEAVWPFPRTGGLITTSVSFLCQQGVQHMDHGKSELYCNCGKTRFKIHPYTYTSSYKGKTTTLVDNCPYTTIPTPPPRHLLYAPPSNPPVSAPLIVTAPITNTFQCSYQTTSTTDFQTSWCACPNGKNYIMTKNVYGISTKGSTSWTTSTCGYTAIPSLDSPVITTPPPPPTPTGPIPTGYCSSGKAVHWERAAASSIVTKFCSQMSASYKTYAGSKDINTLEGNHKSWDGSKTDRSYPVKTSLPEGFPDLKNPKAMKIRITHDEKACNATQQDTGCHFDFRASVKRCEYWLGAALGSCKSYGVIANGETLFESIDHPEGKDWVPPVGIKGDGVHWEVLQGKNCREPPADGSIPLGYFKGLRCWLLDWMESDAKVWTDDLKPPKKK